MIARAVRLACLALLACFLPHGLRAQDTKTPGDSSVPPEILEIDTMDDLSKNSIGGRNSTYLQAPSRAAYTKAEEYGKNGAGLKITYDLKNEGGPRGDGGFCGFYTIVKKGHDGYLDASPYKFVTFWVKGEKGEEKFKVGIADKMYEAMDDSVKSQEIGNYLPAGRVTADWQLAVIPIDQWFVDWKMVSSFSICFEHDMFENGAGAGMVYLDDFSLAKTKPSASNPPGPASGSSTNAPPAGGGTK